MLPVRDDNPSVLMPVVTYMLIGMNCAVWLLVQGLGSEPSLSRSVCQLGLIPGELLGTVEPGTQFALGPNASCIVSDQPSFATLVTSMFLHGGWLHLIGNMWFLWVFGDNVEDSMGHARFAVFYLLCGLAAAGLQVVANPESAVPMVGASGAIGGVMGAYVVLYPRVHVHVLLILGFYVTTVAVPAIFMLGYWLLLQLLGGFSSFGAAGGGVAFWAHVGGFGAGALLVLVLRDPKLVARHPFHGWRGDRSPTDPWQRVRPRRRGP